MTKGRLLCRSRIFGVLMTKQGIAALDCSDHSRSRNDRARSLNRLFHSPTVNYSVRIDLVPESLIKQPKFLV